MEIVKLRISSFYLLKVVEIYEEIKFSPIRIIGAIQFNSAQVEEYCFLEVVKSSQNAITIAKNYPRNRKRTNILAQLNSWKKM